MYVPPVKVLNLLPGFEITKGSVRLPKLAFETLLRAAFREDAFDAAWYRATYPDVADAISAGDVSDEFSHFIRYGYLEDRKPRAFAVDAEWYETAYPDVGEAVRAGTIADSRSHFNAGGYWEPRAPDPASASAFREILEVTAGKKGLRL